jgi:hypothetical protein
MAVNDSRKQPVMCIYKIKNPRSCLCIEDISEFPMEQEVLILPFTVFVVMKVDNDGMNVSDESDPMKVITLEECTSNSC